MSGIGGLVLKGKKPEFLFLFLYSVLSDKKESLQHTPVKKPKVESVPYKVWGYCTFPRRHSYNMRLFKVLPSPNHPVILFLWCSNPSVCFVLLGRASLPVMGWALEHSWARWALQDQGAWAELTCSLAQPRCESALCLKLSAGNQMTWKLKVLPNCWYKFILSYQNKAEKAKQFVKTGPECLAFSSKEFFSA